MTNIVGSRTQLSSLSSDCPKNGMKYQCHSTIVEYTQIIAELLSLKVLSRESTLSYWLNFPRPWIARYVDADLPARR